MGLWGKLFIIVLLWLFYKRIISAFFRRLTLRSSSILTEPQRRMRKQWSRWCNRCEIWSFELTIWHLRDDLAFLIRRRHLLGKVVDISRRVKSFFLIARERAVFSLREKCRFLNWSLRIFKEKWLQISYCRSIFYEKNVRTLTILLLFS